MKLLKKKRVDHHAQVTKRIGNDEFTQALHPKIQCPKQGEATTR